MPTFAISASIVLWLLVIWALIDTNLYLRDLVWLGALWLMLLILYFVFIQTFGMVFVAVICFMDLVLLVRQIGNPSLP